MLRATAVNYQPVGQIIGRDGNADAIPGEHSNVMSPHASRQLGSHDGTTLVDLDGVLAPAQCVLNDAFHFQQVTFTHLVSRNASNSAGGNLAQARLKRKMLGVFCAPAHEHVGSDSGRQARLA
jgi:hypothetical protein